MRAARRRLLAWMGRVHNRFVHERRVRLLAAQIAPLLPGGRLVDIGCGDGKGAAEILKLRPDLRVQGFDVLPRPGCAVPVSWFDGRSVPLLDAEVDAALLIDVLHHADDPVALLRDAARAARVVVVKDHFARNPLDRGLLAIMDWISNHPYGVDLRFKYFTPASWAAATRAAGVEQTLMQPVRGLYPFPFSLAIGRGLHFIAVLQRAPPAQVG